MTTFSSSSQLSSLADTPARAVGGLRAFDRLRLASSDGQTLNPPGLSFDLIVSLPVF
jgi:hypothetical protein